MVTNMIFLFFIRILTFWNRKYKYYCLYFSVITLYPSFITLLWQAFCDRWPLYVGISSVSIKWTEHYMAAWGYEFYLLVLKVSLTHERYFQHSKHHVDVPSDIVHRIRWIVAVNFRLFQNQKSYPERGIVECLFSVSVDLVRGMTASWRLEKFYLKMLMSSFFSFSIFF